MELAQTIAEAGQTIARASDRSWAEALNDTSIGLQNALLFSKHDPEAMRTLPANQLAALYHLAFLGHCVMCRRVMENGL